MTTAMTPTAMPVAFTARYASRCDGAGSCHLSILPGQRIVTTGAAGHYRHADCTDPDVRDESQRAEWDAKVPPVGLDLTVFGVGENYVAVHNSAGKLTFLRISHLPGGNWTSGALRPAGWVFVNQYLGGQGVAQRLGSQRPGGRYVGQWDDLLAAVLANPKAAALAFANDLGRCSRCGASLTDEASRAYGQGPVCREQVLG